MRTTRIVVAVGAVALALGSGLLLGGCPVGDPQAGLPIAKAPLDAPRRITPLVADNIDGTYLQLVWTQVPKALKYEIHLGADTNPPLIATITGTTYFVRDLPVCAMQYWRIVAISADDSVSSPTWEFKTICPD